MPPLLTFGSWMGGDRDGNPNVTAAVTAEALEMMRTACLHLLSERLELLAQRVSLSDRLVDRSPELEAALEQLAGRFPEEAARLQRRNPEEPYRRFFSLLVARVRATREDRADGYESPTELLADLRLAQRSLQTGQGQFVAATQLHDTIRQVEVFGFHFARLDIREHAGRHGAAIAEVLSALGVHEAYASLAPAERSALLAREIAQRRPLIPSDLSGLSAETQEVVGTFRALGELLRGRHAGAIQSYVISGTEEPAHLLEVLLLMKESGLAQAGGEGALLRIVPLFESEDSLERSPETLRAVLEPAGLPRRPARGRRRAGGDDRLLGLQQGRGLRRVGLGDLPRADRARRGARGATASRGSSSTAAAARWAAAAARPTARSTPSRPARSRAA